MTDLIEVEVAYAKSIYEQISIKMRLAATKTIMDAIVASNILAVCEDIDLSKQPVGIFGTKMTLSDKLFAGARVEIYQALYIDPKIARRKRSKK